MGRAHGPSWSLAPARSGHPAALPGPGVGLSWCLPGGIPAGTAAASPPAQPFAPTPRPGELPKMRRVAHTTLGGAGREDKHWLAGPWQDPQRRQLPPHPSCCLHGGVLWVFGGVALCSGSHVLGTFGVPPGCSLKLSLCFAVGGHMGDGRAHRALCAITLLAGGSPLKSEGRPPKAGPWLCAALWPSGRGTRLH